MSRVFEQFIDQTHSPHGASTFPSYSPSGSMDKPKQAHKPRLGEQCLSCDTTCLIFRQHSLGGCSLQLAVTASVYTMCRRQEKCVSGGLSLELLPTHHGLQVRPTLRKPGAQHHFPSPCVRNPLEEIANSAPSAQALRALYKKPPHIFFWSASKLHFGNTAHSTVCPKSSKGCLENAS